MEDSNSEGGSYFVNWKYIYIPINEGCLCVSDIKNRLFSFDTTCLLVLDCCKFRIAPRAWFPGSGRFS